MRYYTSTVPALNSFDVIRNEDGFSLRTVYPLLKGIVRVLELDKTQTAEMAEAVLSRACLCPYGTKSLTPNEARIINDIISHLCVAKQGVTMVVHNINEGYSMSLRCLDAPFWGPAAPV